MSDDDEPILYKRENELDFNQRRSLHKGRLGSVENPGFESDSSVEQGDSDTDQGSYSLDSGQRRPRDSSGHSGGTAVTYVGEDERDDLKGPRFAGLRGSPPPSRHPTPSPYTPPVRFAGDGSDGGDTLEDAGGLEEALEEEGEDDAPRVLKRARFTDDIELQEVDDAPPGGVTWNDDVDGDVIKDMTSETPTRRRSAKSVGSSVSSDVPTEGDWDVGIENPLPIDESRARAAARCFEMFLTWLLVACLFILVLGAGSLHLGTLLLMVSQAWKNNNTFICKVKLPKTTCIPYRDLETNTSGMPSCLLPGIPADLSVRTECPVVSHLWTWALLLALTAPDLAALVRCLFYRLRSTPDDLLASLPYDRRKRLQRRKTKAYAVVMVTEILHAIGVGLLVFGVLPLLPTTAHRVAITSCTALVPAVCSLFRPMTGRGPVARGLLHAGNVLAVVGQVSGLCVWPAVIAAGRLDASQHLVWSIPLSLLLVSVRHVFNYLYTVKPADATLAKEMVFSELCRDVHRYRTSIYLVTSALRIPLHFVLMVAVTSAMYGGPEVFDVFFSKCAADQLTSADIPGLGTDWGWVLLINLLAGFACYLSARTATKICAHIKSYAVPLTLCPLLLMGFTLGLCHTWLGDACYWTRVGLPPHLSFTCPTQHVWHEAPFTDWAWLFFPWWLSRLWVARHIWASINAKLAKSDSIFFTPLYDGVLLDTSLLLNRFIQIVQQVYETAEVPKVKICATMWHENAQEMALLLRSICRLDVDQAQRQYCQDEFNITDPDFYTFEAHVFFDDAVEVFDSTMESKGIQGGEFDQSGRRVNGYVQDLLTAVGAASVNYPEEMPISDPEKVETPYGGRLVWTLPGGNTLTVHLKDKAKIKAKKRWSQAMYLHYFLGYELNMAQQLTKRQLQDRADNTFLLTLDGDVDFEPRAVILLLDRMKRDNIVGAVCGRIHPVGAGPMLWYQKFEYALGHWLQKSTEHVMGSVLCSPGCFSLFRGSALMDRNVMKTFTRESTEARHFIQYDQGEDRWLCMLLLKQGWHVEYCAASDAFTQAPTGFEEFFQQRRRWTPSTMTNIMDLLSSWRTTVQRNEHLNIAYIVYQTVIFVFSLLGTGIIFLMMVDSLNTAFFEFKTGWLVINSIILCSFILVCFIFPSSYQIYLAMVLSLGYVVVQAVVLITVILTMVDEGPCSDTFIFFMLVAGVFLLAGLLHPKEFFCLGHGVLYFFLVPCMYMLLMIYSVVNLHVVSWGVREQAHASVNKAVPPDNPIPEGQAERLRRFLSTTAATSREKMGKLAGCCKITCCSRPADVDPVLAEQRALRDDLRHNTELLLRLQHQLDADKQQNRARSHNDANQQKPYPSTDPQSEVAFTDVAAHTEVSLSEGVPPSDQSEDTHPDDVNAEARRITQALDQSLDQALLSSYLDEEGQGERDGQEEQEEDEGSSNSSSDQDADRPSHWLDDLRYLPPGDAASLPAQEERFFQELLQRYLAPKMETYDSKQKIKKDLKDFRDKVALSYLLLNLIFVVTVYTLKQFQVRLAWFCGTSIDPIGLMFIAVFGVILVLQTIGMLAHRVGTVVQIAANTRLSGRAERRARQAVRELFGAVRSVTTYMRSDSTASIPDVVAPPSGRRVTVIANVDYRKLRAHNQRRGLRLQEVFRRRVYQADRAMDPDTRRKSVLFRQTERYHKLTHAKIVTHLDFS